MKQTKTKVATAATVAALAGLTGVAMSAGGGNPEPQQAAAKQRQAKPQVVRRTIHVTKQAPASASAAPAPVAAAPAPAPVAVPSSAPVVVDDHGSDEFEPFDDHGGDDEFEDSDEDHSGHGHGDDDDEDHSGHGGGDDDD